MTVFIAHTEADMDAADLIAKAVERRGLFVEHEGGEFVGRDLSAQDALVLLWSSATAGDLNHLVMERRALDAWADGRLVLVGLDGSPPPLGLRDLPMVTAQPGDWPTLQAYSVAAIEQALRAPLPSQAQAAAAPAAAAPREAPAKPRKPKRARKARAKGGGLGVLFWLIGILVMIGAGAFAFDRLRYAVFDLPTTAEDYIAPGAGVLVSLVLLIWLFRKGFAPSEDKAPTRAENSEPRRKEKPVEQTGGPVFVSYAHDDAVAVGPVVAAVERAGRPVWIDKTDINAGAGWAGEIVRAIRGAEGVMVVCTPAAFRSDHVKREVYLADRYQKPLMPVMLAPAHLPEDFEYFFAGVQWLELHRIPEADRAAAIKQALTGA